MDNEKTNNQNEKNETKKSKIIPSYEKGNKSVDKNLNKKAKKQVNEKRKKIIIILITSLLVICLAIFGIIYFINQTKYKPYKSYEEKMKTYGFDKAYSNESANTGDSITKSEAIKLVLAAVFNTNDISGFAKEPDGNNNYDNAMWVEYAKYRGITTDTDINKDNYSDKATYIEVIRYFATVKTKILEKELDTAVQLKVKDIDKYKSDEQVAIEDMIQNEIITINTRKINGNKHIFKGQMNEIISNFVEKYNTITVNGEKLNINEDKMPSNKDEYPYTLASVDKSVYEIENYKCIEDRYSNAKDTYTVKKNLYPQIESRINKYFDAILNIDYTTINVNSLKNKLKYLMLYGVDTQELEEYVKYVKEHKIIMKGSSKVNFPAVYYDGRNYRVRTTIEIEYINGDTNKNLFYGDGVDSNIEYDKDKTKIVLDVPMGESIDSTSLSIFNSSLKSWTSGTVSYEK